MSNGKQPTVTSSTGIYSIVVLVERLSLSTTMMQNPNRFFSFKLLHWRTSKYYVNTHVKIYKTVFFQRFLFKFSVFWQTFHTYIVKCHNINWMGYWPLQKLLMGPNLIQQFSLGKYPIRQWLMSQYTVRQKIKAQMLSNKIYNDP